MKSLSHSYAPPALRRMAGLAAVGAAFLCATAASAQAPTPFTFQVSNGTNNSTGDPIESVTDDLTFSNLIVTETFSDGFSTPVSLGSLDTGTIFKDAPATLFDPAHGALSSAVLSGTLGRDGFPAASVLNVTLQQSFGGPMVDQLINSAFSTTLSLSPFSTAPAGSISVGQFALFGGNSPLFGAAPTEIIVTAAVPEASTTVSLGVLLLLGLGGLMTARRRAAAN